MHTKVYHLHRCYVIIKSEFDVYDKDLEKIGDMKLDFFLFFFFICILYLLLQNNHSCVLAQCVSELVCTLSLFF